MPRTVLALILVALLALCGVAMWRSLEAAAQPSARSAETQRLTPSERAARLARVFRE